MVKELLVISSMLQSLKKLYLERSFHVIEFGCSHNNTDNQLTIYETKTLDGCSYNVRICNVSLF